MNIPTYLQSRHVRFERFLHRPAPTASRRAQSMHVSGRFVAKTVLVRAADTYVLAVLPASSRIDLERLSALLNDVPVALAKEDEIQQVFGDCERGALPPFGRLYGIQTIVDASLAGGAEIVCVGNSRHEGLRLSYRDFEAVESPLRGRFTVAAETHRKVG